MPGKIGRSTALTHRGTKFTFRTPLLIPSFSSKGFRVNKDGSAEIEKILEVAAPSLTRCCLISAYDIFHGHVPVARDLPGRPELIVVDSGGYEVADDADLSAVRAASRGRRPWNLKRWHKVVSNWPDEIPTILVSYDHPASRKDIVRQIEEGREAFQKYRNKHLCTLLLKPEKRGEGSIQGVLGKLSNVKLASELGSFDIIGVTEKELGASHIDRLSGVAKLRRALDAANVSAPIHVFGSLDPLGACLFFIAGAEIFDGLTWIRYAYKDGICIYIDNASVGTLGLTAEHDFVRAHTMRDNIVALELLKENMTQFHYTQDFDKLKPHAAILRTAVDALGARLNMGGA